MLTAGRWLLIVLSLASSLCHIAFNFMWFPCLICAINKLRNSDYWITRAVLRAGISIFTRESCWTNQTIHRILTRTVWQFRPAWLGTDFRIRLTISLMNRKVDKRMSLKQVSHNPTLWCDMNENIAGTDSTVQNATMWLQMISYRLPNQRSYEIDNNLVIKKHV